MRNVNGILLLDKPLGLSSNAALQKTKRLYAAQKAGHTGSLDPLASGTLPICFGEAAKFSQFLLDANKSYQVTAQLGVTTTTGDAEGETVAVHKLPQLTPELIQTCLAGFTGILEQCPPMYSALKHQGQPLYKLARQGITVERKLRTITIYKLTLLEAAKDTLTLDVDCSKGTYIRSLVEDIGQMLGCGAHVKTLRRTAVTPFQNQPMVTFTELEKIQNQQGLGALDALLLPVDAGINSFPIIELSALQAQHLQQGKSFSVDAQLTNSQFVRLYHESTFIGLGEVTNDFVLKPHRLIKLSS